VFDSVNITIMTIITIILTTDRSGVATSAFTIEGQDASQAPAAIGDSLDLTLEYVGPTGEVLTENLNAAVQVSLDSLAISAAGGVWAYVPTLPNGFLVTVRDDKGMLKDGRVTLELFLNSTDAAANVDAVGTCVVRVSPATEDIPQCTELSLPEVGQYKVVATYRDYVRVAVVQEITVGRSTAQWEAKPLDAVDVSFSMDKSTLEPGEAGTLRFVNYFEGATLLISRGDGEDPARTFVPTTVGENIVSIPVGLECHTGCSFLFVLSVPQQTRAFIDRFKGIRTATYLDLRAPRVFSYVASLAIRDEQSMLAVAVTAAVPKAAPGANVEVSVELTNPANGRLMEGEVAIFVVDQAFLDVEPHPITVLHLASLLPLSQCVQDTMLSGHPSMLSLLSQVLSDGFKVNSGGGYQGRLVGDNRNEIVSDTWVCCTHVPSNAARTSLPVLHACPY
jgi:hypothetical protein